MAKQSKKEEELEQQVAELTADIQRIQADFVNYKRRAEEDQHKAVAIGRESAIRMLLPTVDNIERALNHVPDDLKDNDFAKAMTSMAKKMESDLNKMGLEKIESVGQPFNPEIMDAISVDEDSEGDEEVVIEEMQPGYKLNGEVIRHAMVKVGKK